MLYNGFPCSCSLLHHMNNIWVRLAGDSGMAVAGGRVVVVEVVARFQFVSPMEYGSGDGAGTTAGAVAASPLTSKSIQ